MSLIESLKRLALATVAVACLTLASSPAYADTVIWGNSATNGSVNLEADSRMDAVRARIPATGWRHDFQKVSADPWLPAGFEEVTQEYCFSLQPMQTFVHGTAFSRAEEISSSQSTHTP